MKKGHNKIDDFTLISFRLSKFMVDESIWKEEIFESTVAAVAREWDTFNNLREKYESGSNKSRKSNLSKNLCEIKNIEESLNTHLSLILKIETNSSVGTANLVKSLNEKRDKILDSEKVLLKLQSKVTCKDTLNALRRRIIQITNTKNYNKKYSKSNVSLSCNNDCSLSWETSFEILIEIENGDSPTWKRQLNRYLSVSELISLGNLVNDSTAVSEKELGCYIPERMRCNQHISNVLNMLQSHFPVLILYKKDCRYIINMHQIDFHN